MSILLDTIRAVSYAIVQLPFVLFLIVVSIVFYRKNKRVVNMQKMIMGRPHISALELTLPQIALGIIGGFVASLLFSVLGIVFNENSYIELIFIISILLMFVKPRFICFSYSGAILGIIAVLINLISNLRVSQNNLPIIMLDLYSLVALVGIMHIIEGLLIIFDGHRGAIPVFTTKNNKIVGGFALKKNWVIPLAILFTQQNSFNNMFVYISQKPSWWSWLGSRDSVITSVAFIGFSVIYAAIGYSSITFTKSKTEKALSSGVFVFGYGALLLTGGLVFKNYYYAEALIIILMPVLHELMIKIQQNIEANGKPKYSSNNGLMILDVAQDSPAFEMGIKSGDVLIEVNDNKINSEKDFREQFSQVGNFIWLKVKNVKGQIKELNYNKLNKATGLGIVIVPTGIEQEGKIVAFDNEKFNEILEKIKKKKDDK